MRKLYMYSIIALTGLAACSGGQLSPQAQRAVDTFECYVASVTPYVGDAIDATELVRETVQGRADLPQALAMLGASAEDVRTVGRALAACRPGPPPAPLEPEPEEYRTARPQ